MTTLAISLGDDDRRFIEESVKSGRYASESDVVSKALSELKSKNASHDGAVSEFREAVRKGIEEADRGDFVEFGADDVKADGRRWLFSRTTELN